MPVDHFPSYPVSASDDIFDPFDDDLFDDQNPKTQPFFGDVTEPTTTSSSPPLPIPTSSLFSFPNRSESSSNQLTSSTDSEWDGKSKGRVGNRESHHNQIKKGEGRDAKKDFWDFYVYEHGFFYEQLRKIEKNSISAKLVFEICRVLREKDRTDKQKLEKANRWAKRRMPNAYAWLDRQREKISKEEFLESVKEAKRRLNH
jgi:hypothetical protein